MARMSKHHNPGCGIDGKCSVPLFQGGSPSGFCDKPAYGQQYSEGGKHAARFGWSPRDRYGNYLSQHRLPPYAPGFCCAAHGGPAKDEIRFVRDGSMWCAFMPGFENLQESLAGFGNTQSEADADLRRYEKAEVVSCCCACDGEGRSWNNADPTSGQWVPCECCGGNQ